MNDLGRGKKHRMLRLEEAEAFIIRDRKVKDGADVEKKLEFLVKRQEVSLGRRTISKNRHHRRLKL